MDFNVTFQLTVYLRSFQAISVSSQGLYYIAVSLCTKNAIVPHSQSQSQNPQSKVRLTNSFYIKYTSKSFFIKITLNQ